MSSAARNRVLPSRACKKMTALPRSAHKSAESKTTFSYMEKLPTEIVHKIVAHLGDKDVCSLLQTCKIAKELLEDDYVWLMRFLNHFDEPIDGRMALKTNVRTVYKQRMTLLSGNINFADYHALKNKLNRAALEVIKDLMIEAKPVLLSEMGADFLPYSKNFSFLERVVESTSLLRQVPYNTYTVLNSSGQQPTLFTDDERPKKRSKSERDTKERGLRNAYTRLYTIQLVLTSYIMDPCKLNCELSYYGLAVSQHAAYQAACTHPVVYGSTSTKVNIPWTLHVVNFFRQHARVMDNPLYSHWEELIASELPQMWNKRLSNMVGATPKLARVWKGTYAFLHKSEVNYLRTHDQVKKYPLDDQNITNLHPIQTMKLWVPDDGQPKEYLNIWENILKGKSLYREPQSLAPKTVAAREVEHAETRKTIRESTFGFDGIGYDDEEFYCVGHINPLPPQNGIPGFARMTMMKYFRTNSGELDTNIMWAYEGVMLPGGQIIVGRWWAPELYQDPHNEYSGPFMMWCVDESWNPIERQNISDFRGLRPKAGPHDYIPGVNLPNPRH